MSTVVRKRFDRLTTAEKTRFIEALKQMKEFNLHIGATGTPSSNGGTYQRYVDWHSTVAEHLTVTFLSWHRAMLWEFEEDLILADIQLSGDGNIAIPYWPWDLFNGLPGTRRGSLWADTFMGGSGSPVASGPFATVWQVHGDPIGTSLRRELGVNVNYLASTRQIRAVQQIGTFDVPPYHESFPPSRTGGYANAAEGWVYGGPGSQPSSWTTGMHNCGHVWVGGHMLAVPIAPNDPVFYLNHANVDLLWAQWQFAHPRLVDQHPSDASINAATQTGGFPRKMDDALSPWDGTAGTRTWRVRDTFNFQLMGSTIPVTPPIRPAHSYTYDVFSRRTLRLT